MVMKKFKLTLMVLLLLAMVLVLVSCGARSFDDLVDEDYEPVDTDPAYTTVNEVSTLADLDAAQQAGDLQLFSKTDPATGLAKYVVYDVANNKIVWQKEETNSESATARSRVSFTVSFNVLKDASYFTVTQTTISQTLEDGIAIKTDTAKTVSVYAFDGTTYTELVKADEPKQEICTTQDLLYFEGKCYRADESGKIAYAFDYSTFVKSPTLSQSTAEYYIERTGNIWIVYDKSLNRLNAYELPSYADVSYSRVLGDKLFVQYGIKEDMYSTDYQVLTENNEKYTFYTLLVDLEKGKEKEIDTEYLVGGTMIASTSASWEKYGFKDMDGKDIAIVRVYEIVDKRINRAQLATQLAVVDAKGNIKILEMPFDMPVDDIEPVAKGIWLVETIDDREYLIDADGKVKGEITQAALDDASFVVANGKLYDFDLNVVYDFEEEELEYSFGTSKSIFFANEDDELILYTAGQKTTLITKRDAEKGIREYSEAYSSLENGYFVIVDESDEDNTKYEIYNIAGKLLKTISRTTQFRMETVIRTDDGAACLVKIITRAEDADKSTTAYYLFK